MAVFSFVAATLLAASSGAPTPIYFLYQQSMHLSSLAVTVVFAVYAFSLLTAMLVIGRLSDHVGRKPVILASLLANLAAMVIFAVASSLEHLILARAVQGVAVGAGIAALGAAILDAERKHGALLNSIFVFLGLLIGTLVSALLVTFAPNPLHLVYKVLLGGTAILIVLLWLMPETAPRKPGAWSSLRPQVSTPRQSRALLLQLTPANVATWAFGGFFLSLMPALVTTTLHAASPLIGGLVVASLTATATAVIAPLRSEPPRRLVVIGTVVLALGVSISLAGIERGSATLLLAGAVIAGIGFGANFSGTLRSLLPTAEPHERAGLLAVYYLQSYLAFSLPTLAAGLAVPRIGLAATAYSYGAVVIVLSLGSLAVSFIAERARR
jgi:MFS family permease